MSGIYLAEATGSSNRRVGKHYRSGPVFGLHYFCPWSHVDMESQINTGVTKNISLGSDPFECSRATDFSFLSESPPPKPAPNSLLVHL